MHPFGKPPIASSRPASAGRTPPGRPRHTASRRRAPLAASALALAVAALTTSPSRGAAECGGTYHVVGTVVNSAGSPVADARIRILLDKVSKRQFTRHGIRAVPTTTDGGGAYGRTVVCSSGDPGPCARSPRHVSVWVNAGMDRTKLRAFRLRDLDLTPTTTGCRVRIPTIELGGF